MCPAIPPVLLPGCGTLIENEIAIAEDAPLADVELLLK